MKIDVNAESGLAGPDEKTTPVFAEIPDTDSEQPADFKTPEQIAAGDDLTPNSEPDSEETGSHGDASTETKSVKNDDVSAVTKPTWKEQLALQWPPRKKEYIIGGILVTVLLCGVGAVLALGHKAKPSVIAPKVVVAKPKVMPKPTVIPSTLTGLPVDPAVNQRPVTAVMVENSLDARPQSGLGEAGVVFEAIAEGGITRFMAVYQDTAPDTIGPIRSARPYYVAWSQGFDAGYAHVGGSQEGLADIRAWGVRDLDQFANGGSYHRIDTRDAPHNVYSGIPTLNQLETAKGYTTSSYTGFVRKPAAPAAAPTAKAIDFALSGYYYNPHFDYNPTSNTYNRSEAGAPQTDQNSGQQLSPNVVIAMVTPLGLGELDSSGAYYSNYSVIGSGPVTIFQDGTVTTGTWTKASNSAQITFTDAAGNPIGLNPGQTWITAVSSAGGVNYTP